MPDRKLADTVRVATHRALAARERLVRQYPAWEAWRRQARDIKAQAIDRLEELVCRLKENIEAWGGRVLFARDAAAARALILEIARRHGVQTVVKSKSMTTEEIRLNSGLEEAGLEVVETDLGEFIIQLAGHPPAHLTAPALHLDRGQIAALFAAHLGVVCAPDPSQLCRAASRHLQARFQEAEMGITGVNFAAAAEGTLVFLENENNLRQSMAMPKVHVAVMGLEKVVPALADLEPLLRLLPASATGQRLTALVHFLNGRKPQPDGSRQLFYLVLLDNGRRRLAADPDLKEALYCVRCAACLNICPVFQTGGAHLYGRVYPGAIGILLAPYLAPPGDISDLCTQCGACGEICPVAISLPEKILAVRESSTRFRKIRLLSRAVGLGLSHPVFYRGLERGLRRAARLFGPGISGITIPPESFYRMRGIQAETAITKAVFPKVPGNRREETPADLRPLSSGPEDGFQETGVGLKQGHGLDKVADLLAEGGQGPLWLEDHPLLQTVAQELAKRGIAAHLAMDSWPGEVDTAVTVGLGAIPETGTAIIGPKSWPAAWLPFRARRQVVLVPPARSGMTFTEALHFTAKQGPGLVTWLTGPTRTTDIEKVLVLGAQGPAALEVIIFSPET